MSKRAIDSVSKSSTKQSSHSVTIYGYNNIKEQSDKKQKTTPVAMTTAMKYQVLHSIIIFLLAYHEKWPRNFLVVCAIHYMTMAVGGPSKARPDKDEDAEQDKADFGASSYLTFQQTLRDLYDYHQKFPWDTTIRSTIEMLARKLVYVVEDGKDDQRDSNHITSSCSYCSGSFHLPLAPIPIVVNPLPAVLPNSTTTAVNNNNNNTATPSNTTTTSSATPPVSTYHSDSEEEGEEEQEE